MSKIQKAGAGRTPIRIKGGLGRVTVYRQNNTNKPFKKPLRKGLQNISSRPSTRVGPLPNTVMAI